MHDQSNKKWLFTLICFITAISSASVYADLTDDMNAVLATYSDLQAPSSISQPSNNPEDIRARRLREWNAAHPQQATQPQNNAYQSPYNDTPQEAPIADDLFTAATNGDVNQIRQLISRGMNINVSNADGETALHMAVAHGHYSAVIYLANQGANINARTIKNWVPLHHAVRFNHPSIANFLIQRGASAYARTSDGLSAIDMAKSTNDLRMLSLLGAR